MTNLVRPTNDPVHAALAQAVAVRADRSGGAPLFVGLCGSQGSGKSTLAAILRDLLRESGRHTEILSLDDLYLPLTARADLARAIHPLLKTRGVPGTHEISLGLRIFAAAEAGESVLLPSFDKAADDRRPESEGNCLRGPLDVLLFEGWCVGAAGQDGSALLRPVNSLEEEEDPNCVWRRYVNDALAGPYQMLFGKLDMLILLAAPSFDVVYGWRLEQENELRRSIVARGEDASRLMSDSQLRRFVSHYERLTRHILEEMPSRADLVVRLNSGRGKTIECRNP